MSKRFQMPPLDPEDPASLQFAQDQIELFLNTAVVDLEANKQPLDADLTAIAALNTDAYGRSLLTANDISSARAILGMVAKRKSANETVNNSTTLQNDDHLSLSVGAGEVWAVDVRLLLNAAGGTTPDWKFAFTVPAGATFYWKPEGSAGAAGAPDGWNPVPVAGTPATLDTTGTLTCGSANVIHGVHLLGTYVGAGTAGTLQFQWAQNTASATNSQVLEHSCMIATRLT